MLLSLPVGKSHYGLLVQHNIAVQSSEVSLKVLIGASLYPAIIALFMCGVVELLRDKNTA